MNHAHGLCAAHADQKRRGIELRAVRPSRPDSAEGYRWCGSCKQFVDEGEFGWDTTRDQPKRTCRPCLAAAMNRWSAANRVQVRLNARLRRRGLTAEEYQALVDAQQGECPICLRTDRPLDIDHCHRSGKVRALLCGPCNRAIGFMGDDPAVAKRAVAYLERAWL
jgi:hypothetical protein